MGGANYMGGRRNAVRARFRDETGRLQRGHFGKHRLQVLSNGLSDLTRERLRKPASVGGPPEIALAHAKRKLETEPQMTTQRSAYTYTARPSTPRKSIRKEHTSRHPDTSSSSSRSRSSQLLSLLDMAQPVLYRAELDRILSMPDFAGLEPREKIRASSTSGSPSTRRLIRRRELHEDVSLEDGRYRKKMKMEKDPFNERSPDDDLLDPRAVGAYPSGSRSPPNMSSILQAPVQKHHYLSGSSSSPGSSEPALSCLSGMSSSSRQPITTRGRALKSSVHELIAEDLDQIPLAQHQVFDDSGYSEQGTNCADAHTSSPRAFSHTFNSLEGEDLCPAHAPQDRHPSSTTLNRRRDFVGDFVAGSASSLGFGFIQQERRSPSFSDQRDSVSSFLRTFHASDDGHLSSPSLEPISSLAPAVITASISRPVHQVEETPNKTTINLRGSSTARATASRSESALSSGSSDGSRVGSLQPPRLSQEFVDSTENDGRPHTSTISHLDLVDDPDPWSTITKLLNLQSGIRMSGPNADVDTDGCTALLSEQLKTDGRRGVGYVGTAINDTPNPPRVTGIEFPGSRAVTFSEEDEVLTHAALSNLGRRQNDVQIGPEIEGPHFLAVQVPNDLQFEHGPHEKTKQSTNEINGGGGSLSFLLTPPHEEGSPNHGIGINADSPCPEPPVFEGPCLFSDEEPEEEE